MIQHAGDLPGSRAPEIETRAAIATICRRLWERGLVAGRDGNVSARIGPDRILVTPSGFSKIDVQPDDLIVVTTSGERVTGTSRPSSEIAVHLRCYAKRPDVTAVVHAHPPFATAFAVAGETIPDDVLPEVSALLGSVPLVGYATPGTEALADLFQDHWAGHDAFLMANHGALTVGTSLQLAHQRMEALEHAAQIIATARTIGVPRTLSSEQVAALRSSRTGGLSNG